MRKPDVVVIGAGSVGICTAYYLAFRGARVTVVDQGRVGKGCSEGNAGQITPGHLPLPQPGTMWRNLYWLTRRDSPLFIKPDLLVRHIDWFLKFARSCSHLQTARATRVLCELGRLSYRLFKQLAARVEFGFEEQGRVEVAADDATLANTVKEARLLRRYGFDFHVLSGREVRKWIPQMRGPVSGGVYYPESAHCEPYRFVRAVAGLAAAQGAEILEGVRVLRFLTSGEQVEGVVTSRGPLAADYVVAAAGAWTPLLVKQLGIRLPVLPGKGYHVDFPAMPHLPTRPLVLVRERVFVTPMNGRVRFAGTMEFSGYNLDLDERRLRLILAAAGRNFGASGEEVVDRWCHWRPMSADGLPFVGPTRRFPNLWIAAGHGMLGLTQGPATGWIVANGILGQVQEVDISPLSPDRP